MLSGLLKQKKKVLPIDSARNSSCLSYSSWTTFQPHAKYLLTNNSQAHKATPRIIHFAFSKERLIFSENNPLLDRCGAVVNMETVSLAQVVWMVLRKLLIALLLFLNEVLINFELCRWTRCINHYLPGEGHRPPIKKKKQTKKQLKSVIRLFLGLKFQFMQAMD